jgi:hypothetical protein
MLVIDLFFAGGECKMTDSVKAIITIGNKTITFEGPRDFVEEQVARFAPRQEASHVTNKPDNSSLPEPRSNESPERNLVLTKNPKNHAQTVAVLAFALAQSGVEEFTADDIRRAYLRAAIRPPKVIGQAIRDAKNLFDYIGHGKRRGTYRLTNHGDRTVRFDLRADE